MLRRSLPFLAVGLVVFALYLIYLHFQITSKFEFHRWNLPSRVYSDSFPLYRGRQVTIQEIKEKLQALGYQEISSAPRAHGEYQQSSGNFEIYLHQFEYPNEIFSGYPIRFTLSNHQVGDIVRGDTGEPVALARLEPELIASLFDEAMEDRTVVKLTEVPEDLIQAIIEIEDARYYSHIGIDPIGIGRAFMVNLQSGRIVQGGSTLTQQLVKNFFLHPKKSFLRKFNEMLMAFLMELRYSKEEILEAYLNEIYLGQRGPASISGVAEAARYYFSKEVTQLSLAECAMIAGMVRLPGYYNPILQPKQAKERRNFVLKRLLEEELILQIEYEQAIRAPLPHRPHEKVPSGAPHFVDFIQKRLKQNFPSDVLRSEGLKIFTTLEMNLQRAAEAAVERRLQELNKADLESAFIALQPQTGHIRAYVGGRDYSITQFDHASEAHRQPGSAFKPFVYLTALDPTQTDLSYTLASILEDEPFSVKAGGELWSPQNYSKDYHGRVPLRRALEKSYNVATARLALNIGLEHVIYTARQAGIKSPLKEYPALSLGVFEVTPLELIMAYSIFPNQGVKTEPVAIRQVVTPEGEVLEKKDFEMKKVFSEDVIFLMNQLLKGVLDRGTAASARAQGFHAIAAGKTGTTSDYRDAWFVGYTPDLLALSWIGYDDNRVTGLSGSSGALPIWTTFMKAATTGRGTQDFPATPNIILVPIDRETGLLAKNRCGSSYDEYFIEGTEPKKYCDEE